MSSAARESRSLAEVKAVLEKLHRLDLPPDREEERTKNPASLAIQRSEVQGKSDLGGFDRKLALINSVSQDANRPPRQGSLRIVLYALILGIVFVIAAINQGLVPGVSLTIANGLVLNTTGNAVLAVGAEKSAVAVVLAEARRLLQDGDVVKTRQTLLAANSMETPEIVFLLAQSYDPNYLRSLSKSNAEPDRVLAERWYRKWHELAQNAGLEMDNVRLKRIINSMQ